MTRYNKGKKGSPNLDAYIVQTFLDDELALPQDQEKIENLIRAKDLPISEDPDWSLVHSAIQEFAKNF